MTKKSGTKKCCFRSNLTTVYNCLNKMNRMYMMMKRNKLDVYDDEDDFEEETDDEGEEETESELTKKAMDYLKSEANKKDDVIDNLIKRISKLEENVKCVHPSETIVEMEKSSYHINDHVANNAANLKTDAPTEPLLFEEPIVADPEISCADPFTNMVTLTDNVEENDFQLDTSDIGFEHIQQELKLEKKGRVMKKRRVMNDEPSFSLGLKLTPSPPM